MTVCGTVRERHRIITAEVPELSNSATQASTAMGKFENEKALLGSSFACATRMTSSQCPNTFSLYRFYKPHLHLIMVRMPPLLDLQSLNGVSIPYLCGSSPLASVPRISLDTSKPFSTASWDLRDQKITQARNPPKHIPRLPLWMAPRHVTPGKMSIDR